MKIDDAPSKTDPKQPGSKVPQPLADAVVSCLALRDLVRIQAHYPGVVQPSDAEELRAGFAGHLRAALANGAFDDLCARPCGLNLKNPASDDELSVLFIVLLLRMPGTVPTQPEGELAPEAMRAAVAACQARTVPPLADLARQLLEIKLYDCRIPEGDPRFSDPRRSLQMLRSYWSICRSVVLHQIDASVGWHPHPLHRILANARARIDGHLARLGDRDGGRKVRAAIDTLLDTLLGGDPNDLSAVPDWSRQHVQTVEGFLEDARLRSGSKAFQLTHEEAAFISHAESEVRRYQRQADEIWARMQTVVTAQSPTPAGGTAGAAVAADAAARPTPPVLDAAGRPADPRDPVSRDLIHVAGAASGAWGPRASVAVAVEALSSNAERLRFALQKRVGRPWPGSAALRRDAGTSTSGGVCTAMHRATFGSAVGELVTAGLLDLKGKEQPRKGCAWALLDSPRTKVEPKSNQS